MVKHTRPRPYDKGKRIAHPGLSRRRNSVGPAGNMPKMLSILGQ